MKRLVMLSWGIVLTVAACGDDPNNGIELDPSFEDGTCSSGEDRSFIQNVSERFYLYPDQLPDLAISDFDNARSYLQALVENVDLAPDNANLRAEDRFSFVTTVQRFEEFTTRNFVRLGIRYELEEEPVDGERGLRLTDVLGATDRENPAPAGDAGLNRGDRILTLNGNSIETILAEREEGLSEGAAVGLAFGPGEEGSQVDLTGVRPDGSRFEVRVVRQRVEETEVPVVEIFERSDGRNVGYVVYRGFSPSSAEDLRIAAMELEEAGVTDLILDLRYNGGGRVAVAEYLANLIYGVPGENSIFSRTVYNEQNSNRSSSSVLGEPICPEDSGCQGVSTPLTGIESLTFITTGSSASASELLINGLSPYLPVQIVGTPSTGKPVGSLGFRHRDCDQVYAPITFRTVNAEGVGDYFNGFAVDCPAEDDTTRVFGDENEASLAAALALVDGEPCPTSAAQARALRSAARRAEHRSYTELLDALRWQ